MARAGYAGRLLFLFMALLTAILAGCGGKGGSEGSSGQANTSATVERLEVNPVDSQAAKGTTRAFTATAIFSNDSKQDVTREVSWSSSNTAIAAMDSSQQGLARAVAEGQVDITASLQGKSASAKLVVTPATLQSMQIDPVSKSMPKGTEVQFTVTALFSDGSSQDLTAQAEWASSAENVAFVSNAPDSKGQVEGLTQGTAKILATVMSQTVESTVTVTNAEPTDIQITPEEPELGIGGELRFVATATYSDGSKIDVTYSRYVDWSSSDTSVATISNIDGPQPPDKGRAEALMQGVTTISVDVPGLPLRDSVTLRVVPVRMVGVDVEPSTASMGLGASRKFYAYAKYNDGTRLDVTRHTKTLWSSSQTEVASVSNASDSSGLVKALTKGTTTISAVHDGMTGSAQLTVTDATAAEIEVSSDVPKILPQTTLQFRALGTFTDGSVRDVTHEVRWGSQHESVAKISNAEGSWGLATGLSGGTSYMVASMDGTTGARALYVEDDELQSITIRPDSMNLSQAGTYRLYATANFAHADSFTVNQAMTWSSSDDSVVTVSNEPGSQGVITGVERGSTAIITALDTRTGKKGTSTVTVTNPAVDHIEITPADVTLPVGLTQQFKATVYYKNGTSEDATEHVAWSVDDTRIATVGGTGRSVVKARATGQTMVRAVVMNHVATATLTVTDARLDSIAVTPENATLRNGGQLQYAAVGTYSDGSTRTITDLVTWASSHTNWVSISNSDGSHGLAQSVGGTPLVPVTVTISASLEGASDSTTVTRRL